MRRLLPFIGVGLALLQAPSCAREATGVVVARSEPDRVEQKVPLRDPEVRHPPSSDAAVPRADEGACRGFAPGGRIAQARSTQCAGPAKDRVTGERDRAALRKLQEVLDAGTYYLGSARFDEDVATLLGISEACETRCTPPVQAKIWMYLGLYYGSGMNRLDDSRCAFQTAIEWEPGIALDEALATEAVKAAFAAAHDRVCGA